ncbi:MAG: excinuclease ABC subunit UvrA [Oscillospiraceae bacterium]|nr:excinuclease ABC subunit UvrA [Oscillospiraceae bacterium]
MDFRKNIIVQGAREHNLKNINVSILKNKITVITGVSGSGKSSLAFDTIHAEGQRRYIESLSSYARQFLGQFKKPDVDCIKGLSPTISIDQKTTHDNPRSTVGTITEIYDYLRLLWSKIGVPHCPICYCEIKSQSVDQIIDKIINLPKKTRIQILAPIVVGKKGEYSKKLENIKKSGFVRVRIDGKIFDLNEKISIKKDKVHNIEVIVDRLIINENIRTRLSDSCETAIKISDGSVVVNLLKENKDLMFNQNYACPKHGISIGKLEPRMFSFNSLFGACKKCAGLGFLQNINADLLISNKKISIRKAFEQTIGFNGTEFFIRKIPLKYKKLLDTPISKLNKNQINTILYSDNKSKYEGLIPNLQKRYLQTTSNWMKEKLLNIMAQKPCETCDGNRLSAEILAITVNEKSIAEFCKLSVIKALKFIKSLKFTKSESIIANNIVREIKSRLEFLKDAGLEYLTLHRQSGTLSGGESQRIRLASSLGSLLTGVVYILDEPSIGLHQSDNRRLIGILKQLRDLGNTVLIVEHDEEMMQEADFIIDIGLNAGADGGKLIFSGTFEDIKKCDKSLTGKFLNRKERIEIPKDRRRISKKIIKIIGARQNNLKNINVKIPLEVFTCVTGVSGSGKSSLINEILYKFLARELNRANTCPGKFKKISGSSYLDKIIEISQTPIGRTPRSNPATYTGTFTEIRKLFASTNSAKSRGFTSSRFSFNTKGGRCEACTGDGIKKIEMLFLPDVFLPCEVCNGHKYNRETLEVKYKNKNISDVLNMTCSESLEFFKNFPKIIDKIQTLCDVGLSYIRLGQPSTTLSGGEAQRIKLATELAKKSTGKTIYILDEPTTGLHSSDIKKLINILQRLVNSHNTVIVIEHNLDLIKTADYIIDLGPKGGDAGGTVIATGTPEEVAKCDTSLTGKFLRQHLDS